MKYKILQSQCSSIALTTILYLLQIPSLFGQSNFDYFHPPHSILGKWEKRANDATTLDTIKCYVIEPFKIESILGRDRDTIDIIEVSQKAIRAWNNALETTNIPIRLKVIELPKNQANSNDILFDTSNTKNLIGVTNNRSIPNNDDANRLGRFIYGGNFAQKFDTINLKTQIFRIKRRAHIAINQDFIRVGLLRRTQANRSENQRNIYLTMCHELGHLLGLVSIHCVPPESIMRTKQRSATLESYDGTGEIPLDEFDKKLLKTVYHQFFLPNRHSNPSCIPISNLPTANGGYIILIP